MSSIVENISVGNVLGGDCRVISNTESTTQDISIGQVGLDLLVASNIDSTTSRVTVASVGGDVGIVALDNSQIATTTISGAIGGNLVIDASSGSGESEPGSTVGGTTVHAVAGYVVLGAREASTINGLNVLGTISGELSVLPSSGSIVSSVSVM